MSRRFGRNQRRKMRERLAAYADENIRMGFALRGMSSDLRRQQNRTELLEQQLAIAKVIIGRNHPAFPAERLDMGFFPAPGEHFERATGPRDIVSMAAMAITANRDTVFNQVHFRLIHGGVVSGYAVSVHAMRTVPEGILCDAITRELVGVTINEYRKVKGGAA